MKTLPLRFHIEHVATTTALCLGAGLAPEVVVKNMAADCEGVARIFGMKQPDVMGRVYQRVEELRLLLAEPVKQ